MDLPVKLVRFKKKSKKGEGKGKSGNDRCVVCWCPTEYEPSVPIALRQYYVEGCGQMCEACYLRAKMAGGRITLEEAVSLTAGEDTES